MSERWVINASPIIVLAKIDSDWLITELADEIILPQAVVDEINAGPEGDPARRKMVSSPWPIREIEIDPLVMAWDLGAGETAVLSYAFRHEGWRAVVDDAAARRCARTLEIPTLGALGIILKARQNELIPAAAPLLKEMVSQGFRLNDQVIRRALQTLVDEDWP